MKRDDKRDKCNVDDRCSGRGISMLGAICGSAQSMDLPAQSMDPLSSIVCADIHGCLRNLWILRRMQIISLQ